VIELSSFQIFHPRFKSAFEQARDAIELCADRGAIVPILGPTRVGKNELVSELGQHFGEMRCGPGYIFPNNTFAVGAISPQPNSGELFRAIGRAMGAEFPVSWKMPSVKQQVINMVHDRGTRHIVLDECSHCAEPGANFSPRAAADHWKEFVDATDVTLILTGLPKFQTKIIDGNEQFRERSMSTVFLLPYNWLLDHDRADFVDTVDAIFRHMEIEGLNLSFDETDMTRRLYAASGGRVGIVVELLNDALKPTSSEGVLDFQTIASTARKTLQRARHLKDFFEAEQIADSTLMASYQGVMSDAGLSIPNKIASVDDYALSHLKSAAE
jgi:hypothetical protein